ncbi:ABC transporter permease subunit [Thiomicrospira sp. WB1]|uniref:ABC transporter permease subunit n=1 Tax=Thiomicrospira sp. WB1 TaxID=1685380 RepID=UPI000746467B|nr:ABC transporter permease subunit [Thiomicrospira sp. WB1]KUJ71510.1 phosphate ABC transporter permease [Thiomicrospira sp. WB1]
MDKSVQRKLDEALDGPKFQRRIKRRNLVDLSWASGFTVGGIAVIASVLLIMFFLVYVVAPLFAPADIEQGKTFDLQQSGQEQTLYYGVDEYADSALRISDSGRVYGIDLSTGEKLRDERLPIGDARITSFTRISQGDQLMGIGLDNGSVLLVQYEYSVTYPDDVKTITPKLTYPFGQTPLTLSEQPITHLSARKSGSQITFAYQVDGASQIYVKQYDMIESMLTEEVTLDLYQQGQFAAPAPFKWLKMGISMRNLYALKQDGTIFYFDIRDPQQIKLVETVNALAPDQTLTAVQFLIGEYSLLLGNDQGQVAQWFPVRDQDNNYFLKKIRTFEVSDQPIQDINVELNRKNFAVLDASNQVSMFNSTAHNNFASFTLDQTVSQVHISPRGDRLLIETPAHQLVTFDVDNEHPEVSMSSLWGEVWYEGYDEPEYVWQSSSASNDFEPKFSLMPLTFGTIKAALYSMLFAVPLAVLGAIYTAFFMDAKTRQVIKPTIELIEALPTVILGFLAGLWLAPYMEAHLAGFFSIIFLVPIGILLFGYLWSRLPEPVRLLVPTSKRAVLMLPVVVIIGFVALSLSGPLEHLLFDGDMRHWLTDSAGIDFDQRNAMVIGFAMGFALIPTIFSVAEDAIYNVPSYLVNGSLALGASGWQTMVGVVLPTASPGIFSAIMLGFGRGIGETMIVLMASGNTPLMDANLFEGMRTLSANLAVEMPEAALDSTHYRVLFLSGLVLFIFTFIFNTLAEVVRERMRRKYGSL